MTKIEASDDFRFIMTCLKHTAEKLPRPNFEEVAKETGAKNATACYQRHWGIMKKWGLAGNSGNRKKLAAATASKGQVADKKRGRPTTKKPASKIDGDEDESDSDSNKTSIKRAKKAKLTEEEKNGEEAEESEGEYGPDELA